MQQALQLALQEVELALQLERLVQVLMLQRYRR
jgi:hypothetical protein